MSEQNKEVVARSFDVWNSGDWDVVDEVVAEGAIQHDPYNTGGGGPEGMKAFVGTYRQAFPDLQMTVDEQVADGDIVATRWHATGTHTEEIMGFAPTGASATTTGMSFNRLEDGKIVESWSNWDTFGLMQAIGAIPSAEAGAAS